MASKTVVLTDEKEILEAIIQFQSRTRKIWRACVDPSLPAFSVGVVREGYAAAIKRGVKIKYITEITKENRRYCNLIMNFAELRHLEGVKGNFALSETEYIAGIKKGNFIATLVRSNLRELVRQQHLVFETLWRHAIPAKQRLSTL